MPAASYSHNLRTSTMHRPGLAWLAHMMRCGRICSQRKDTEEPALGRLTKNHLQTSYLSVSPRHNCRHRTLSHLCHVRHVRPEAALRIVLFHCTQGLAGARGSAKDIDAAGQHHRCRSRPRRRHRWHCFPRASAWVVALDRTEKRDREGNRVVPPSTHKKFSVCGCRNSSGAALHHIRHGLPLTFIHIELFCGLHNLPFFIVAAANMEGIRDGSCA
mmetsp:Transcript_130355/g.260015  ORF Transcript_130355/g.260015 Transcript_130355/m.260015 type:complete len:216 (+) Transcript_130355:21-668(+)